MAPPDRRASDALSQADRDLYAKAFGREVE